MGVQRFGYPFEKGQTGCRLSTFESGDGGLFRAYQLSQLCLCQATFDAETGNLVAWL